MVVVVVEEASRQQRKEEDEGWQEGAECLPVGWVED